MILQNISIQDIQKVNFLKWSLKMTRSIVRLYIEKTNIPKCHKKDKQIQHEMCKTKDGNNI
jgi:hypothetical protein